MNVVGGPMPFHMGLQVVRGEPMIRVLGGPKRLCDGLTLRDLLQVEAIGLLGLGGEALSGASARAGAVAPAAPV